MNSSTGFVFHELCLWHNTGNAAGFFEPNLTVEPDSHAESPATKRRIRNLLDVSGLLDQLQIIKPKPATEAQILRFHTRQYFEAIKRMSAERGGDAGELTPFGTGSFEIACLAVGGTIAAIDSVLAGEVRNAYALVRPCGHHAEANRGRGFCIFGNVAIGVMHARAERGVGRVAIVDWDVHHGNGTQSAFYEEPNVLTISVHQDGLYPPDSGSVEEIGNGAGRGCNMNIPLPPGSGVGAYTAAFERIVAPAIRAFKPDLLVVASGFDANGMDPLARMMMHSDGYRKLTQILIEVADDVCGGRLAMSHEGGYSTAVVPYCGLAVIETLAGHRTEVVDPWAAYIGGWGHQTLQPHQSEPYHR